MQVTEAWRALVQHYADEAARDPARRAARLEEPPMIEGAQGDYRWHEADLAYRQQLQQLKTEAERQTEAEGAPWWMLARILYSWELVHCVIAVLIAYWILEAMGVF